MRPAPTYRNARRNAAKWTTHQIRQSLEPSVRASVGRIRFANVWPKFRLEKGKWK